MKRIASLQTFIHTKSSLMSAYTHVKAFPTVNALGAYCVVCKVTKKDFNIYK